MVKGKAEPRLVVKPVGHFQAGAELDDVTEILAVALFVQSNGGVRRQHPVLAEKDVEPQPELAVDRRVGRRGDADERPDLPELQVLELFQLDEDRKSVVPGKSVQVTVDLGG